MTVLGTQLHSGTVYVFTLTVHKAGRSPVSFNQTYKWSAEDQTGVTLDLNEVSTSTGRHSPNLVVRSGVLQPGQSYTFTLNVSQPGRGRWGSASLTIHPNNPPHGGLCELSPEGTRSQYGSLVPMGSPGQERSTSVISVTLLVETIWGQKMLTVETPPKDAVANQWLRNKSQTELREIRENVTRVLASLPLNSMLNVDQISSLSLSTVMQEKVLEAVGKMIHVMEEQMSPDPSELLCTQKSNQQQIIPSHKCQFLIPSSLTAHLQNQKTEIVQVLFDADLGSNPFLTAADPPISTSLVAMELTTPEGQPITIQDLDPDQAIRVTLPNKHHIGQDDGVEQGMGLVLRAVCQYYSVQQRRWSSEGLQPLEGSTLQAAHCLTQHLTMFGASMFLHPGAPGGPVRNLLVGMVCAVLVLIHLLLGLIAHKLDHLERTRLSRVPLCGRPGLHQYRVLTDHMFFFLLEDWLSVENQKNGSVEKEVLASCPEELSQFRRVFSSQLMFGMVEHHLWLSLWERPPHSRFSRGQRVTCSAVVLLLYLALGALWYGAWFLCFLFRKSHSQVTVDTSVPPSPVCHSVEMDVFLGQSDLSGPSFLSLSDSSSGPSSALDSSILDFWAASGLAPQKDGVHQEGGGVETWPSCDSLLNLPACITETPILCKASLSSRQLRRKKQIRLAAPASNKTPTNQNMKSNLVQVHSQNLTTLLTLSGVSRGVPGLLLPPWTLTVIYPLLGSLLIASLSVIGLYGSSFSRALVLMWLLSSLSAFLTSALLLEPLKVCVQALICTLLWRPVDPEVEDHLALQSSVDLKGFGDDGGRVRPPCGFSLLQAREEARKLRALRALMRAGVEQRDARLLRSSLRSDPDSFVDFLPAALLSERSSQSAAVLLTLLLLKLLGSLRFVRRWGVLVQVLQGSWREIWALMVLMMLLLMICTHLGNTSGVSVLSMLRGRASLRTLCRIHPVLGPLYGLLIVGGG
ncbi:hypothetical protein F7725_013893, partial [Dissostichus mawsoni]